MSRCANSPRAFIFAAGALAEAVSDATFCLSSGEASRRPLVSPWYHIPICFQFCNPWFCAELPGGKNETIIWPATPCQGGILSSCFIPLMSLTLHCDWFPDCAGFTSG